MSKGEKKTIERDLIIAKGNSDGRGGKLACRTSSSDSTYRYLQNWRRNLRIKESDQISFGTAIRLLRRVFEKSVDILDEGTKK